MRFFASAALRYSMVSGVSAKTNTLECAPNSSSRFWNASSFESRGSPLARVESFCSFASPEASSPADSAAGELPSRRKSAESTAPDGSFADASAARTSRSSSFSSGESATSIFVSDRGVKPPTTARRLRSRRAESP